MKDKIDVQMAQLAAIDQSMLTPLVRQALRRDSIEIDSWECDQLHGGAGEGNAVYRITGQGHEGNEKISWSLILKTIHPGDNNRDSSAWNYYRREPDAYQSGWLDALLGNLTAPRSFGVVEHADGVCWIWLEDVRDEIGSQWPLEHYNVVARHLGQFNGAFLMEGSLPSRPWLSTGWLRKYVAVSAPAFPLIRKSLDNPLVRRTWPGDTFRRLFRLWEERDLYFDALDRLPQTICHLDMFRRNLFARKTADGEDQTVVIDWSYVGQGAIGQELVPLTLAGFAFNEVDYNQVQVLEVLAFDGYLQGLHDAGWRGDPKQVRLGYAAASLRYRFAEIWKAMQMMLDKSQHSRLERVFGVSMEENADHWALVGSFVDSLTDEAFKLMDIFG